MLIVLQQEHVQCPKAFFFKVPLAALAHFEASSQLEDYLRGPLNAGLPARFGGFHDVGNLDSFQRRSHGSGFRVPITTCARHQGFSQVECSIDLSTSETQQYWGRMSTQVLEALP